MALIDGFEWSTERCGRVLRSGAFGGAAMHLFTTRQLRLRGPSEEDEWALVAGTLGVEPSRLVRLHQVHGSEIVVIRRGDAIPSGTHGWPHADIVMTDDPSVALAVQVADCVPVLICDRKARCAAAIHAGWRGSCAGAVPKALESMSAAFGVDRRDLVAVQGPSIGPCCYEVGDELPRAFALAHTEGQVDRWFRRDASGRLILDLWKATADQLKASGIPGDAIQVASLCTACRADLFHSYRREGAGTGRMTAAIRLLEKPAQAVRVIGGRPADVGPRPAGVSSL